MSDFLAEARIAIRPDTRGFRTELLAELQTATRGVTVNVPITVATTGAALAQQVAVQTAAAAKATSALGAAQSATATTGARLGVAQVGVAQTATAAAAAQTRLTTATASAGAAARSSAVGFEQLRRGGASTALSLLGIRGATLAASSAFLAGAAAVTTFAKAIGIAAEFERELAVFRETAGASADEMVRVADAARELGADITLPAVSAADAAQAMAELARAGLSVQDSIDGARGVLQLATAAAISNADAVELAASALNAFGLAGNQAVRVADVLANAANQAQGSITDVGIALRQAAAVGRQVGLTLEDTTALLTILAREGLKGSDAGTSLRTAFLRLVNPTDKAKEKIADLGLQIRNAQGDIRPDVFVNFGIATEGMTKQARDAAAAIIFGQDAIRAVAIASRQSVDELLATRDALTETGTAADLAAARTVGLGGAAQGLVSNLETVGIAVGGSVTPALSDFVRGIDSAVVAISQSDQVRETLRASLTGIGDAFQVLGTTVEAVGTPLLGLAGISAQVVTSIGVTEILAGAAAYRILPPILARAGNAAKALATSFAAARASAIGLAATSRLLAAANLTAALTTATAGLRAFATSTAGVGLAVGVLAAGLVFLATRETDTERATRSLADASDDLTDSFGGADAAARSLADAVSSIRTDELAVQSAKLAVEQEKARLASLRAAEGSAARRQQENAVAVALDNLRLAEERLVEARRRQKEAAEEQAVSSENVRAARQREVEAINRVISAQREAASGPRPEVKVHRENVTLQELEAQAVEKTIVVLRERAAAERQQNTEASREIGRRLEALARLAEATERVPTSREIEIILQSETLQQGLIRVVKQLGDTGDRSAKEFAAALLAGLHQLPVEVTRFLDTALDLAEIFKNAGRTAGAALGQGVKEGVEQSGPLTVKQLLGQVAGFEERLTDINIGGGSEASKIPILEEEAERLRAAIARSTGVEGRRKLKKQLDDVLDRIGSIQDEIKSDAEQRRDEIRQKRENAFQAIIDTLQAGITQAQNQAAISALTGSTDREISGLVGVRQAITGAINRLRREGKQALDEIRDLQGQRIAIQESINSLFKEQREERQRAAQENLERREQAFELNIRFAEITENRGAEVRARQAFIAFLEEQKRNVKKDKNRVLELRNEIAEQRAAIKKLKGEAEGAGKDLGEMLSEHAALIRFAPNIGQIGTDPFSGFDITASLTAALKRLQDLKKAGVSSASAPTLPRGVPPPSPGRAGGPVGVQDSTDRLITALDRNTDAVLGNTTTVGRGPRTPSFQGSPDAIDRWWQNRQARQQTEDSIGG